MSTISEKLVNYSVSQDVLSTMLSECTLSTLKSIIQPYMIIPRKFEDELDEELVKKYRPKMNVGLAIKIFNHLQTQTVQRKVNQYDASTLISPSHKVVEIGNSKMSLVKEDTTKVEIEFNNGVVGEISVAESLSTVLSVGTKHVENKKGSFNKETHFHVNNEFAPSQALIKMSTDITDLKAPTPSQLALQAKQIKDLAVKEKTVLIDNINEMVPKITIMQDNAPVKVPIIQYKSTTVEYRTPSVNYRKMEGEFQQMALQYQTYQSGTGYQAIKRIGKNMWTGVPIDTMNIDHVMAMHEAGIKVDSNILVISSDTNLISMLRSNFGPNLYGIGSQSGMVPKHTASSYKFDYVYYPKPIGFNASGTFTTNVQQTLDSIRKKMEIYSSGKPVFHFNPLLLYCKEVAEVFGKKVESPSGQRLAKVLMAAVPAELKPVKQDFVHSKVTNYPIKKPDTIGNGKIECYEYYEKNLNLVLKFHGIEKEIYTCMEWSQVQGHSYPCKLTNMSWEGVVTYSEELPLRPIGVLLGETISYLREVYKAVWIMAPRSPNTYTIRRIIKGAVVEGLEWDDTWSAMYDSTVKKEMETIATQQYEEQSQKDPETIVKEGVTVKTATDEKNYNCFLDD